MGKYRECPKCGSLIDSQGSSCKFCKTKDKSEKNKIGIFSKIKASYAKYQDEQAKKKVAEGARKKSILSGKIESFTPSCNLEKNEKAYAEFPADRMAIVEHIEEHSIGKSHRKGVLGRAIVGGVLLGPLGALGGAATAGSRSESTSIQKKIERIDKIDSGKLIFTNKRLLFIGNEFWHLSHKEVIYVEFRGNQFYLKYPEMKKGEYFVAMDHMHMK